MDEDRVSDGERREALLPFCQPTGSIIRDNCAANVRGLEAAGGSSLEKTVADL